jgi:hypothetical protein
MYWIHFAREQWEALVNTDEPNEILGSIKCKEVFD